VAGLAGGLAGAGLAGVGLVTLPLRADGAVGIFS
jgi:hypothetical protein